MADENVNKNIINCDDTEEALGELGEYLEICNFDYSIFFIKNISLHDIKHTICYILPLLYTFNINLYHVIRYFIIYFYSFVIHFHSYFTHIDMCFQSSLMSALFM